LDGWIEVSQRYHGGLDPNPCPDLSFPYWRWQHDERTLELPRLGTSNETQGLNQASNVPIFPRHNWGDFEALSYCWESEKAEKEIVLDGTVTGVPKNLEAALQAFRTLPETKTGMKFWIDYLCINQKDTKEKNHQVNLMGTIYSSALSVIAWLGPEDNGSDKAIQLIADINCAVGHRFYEELRSHALWEKLNKFLSRNYWTRLWIIQELALNPNMTLFLCGTHALSRKFIESACSYYMLYADESQKCQDGIADDNLLELQSNMQRAERVGHLVVMYTQAQAADVELAREALHRLLEMGRRAKAKNSRDKIYGLLGLLPRALGNKICPDYDLSLGEVYKDFARSVLETSDELDGILSWCTYAPDSGMPSWVPDWRASSNRDRPPWEMNSSRRWDPPPESIVPNWRVDNNYNNLVCTGIFIDTIAITGFTPKVCSSCYQKPAPVSSSIVTGVPQNRYGSFQAVKAALARTLLRNDLGSDINSESVLDIYWIDWDIINNTAPDDLRLFALWTWGMAEVTEKPLLWRTFDSFRQFHASFSVLGYPFRSFFPDMLTYPCPGHQAIPSLNAQGIKRDCNNSAPVSTPVDPGVPRLGGLIASGLFSTMRALKESKLATTKSGHLALVPDVVSVGDVVAILFGCKFPVVLRPKGHCFLYISECYVDGIMDGEIWDANIRGENELVEITIC
jgi:hypothetical protein